ADGSYTLAGASTRELRVGAAVRGISELNQQSEFVAVPASAAPVVGLSLVIAESTRTIDVIVRSAVAMPLEGGQVILLRGRQQLHNLGDVIRMQTASMQTHMARPLVGENVPRAALDRARSGDLIAHIEQAFLGELTACAFGLSGDLHD